MTVGELKKRLELELDDSLEIRIAWGHGSNQPTTPLIMVNNDLVNKKDQTIEYTCAENARNVVLFWVQNPLLPR